MEKLLLGHRISFLAFFIDVVFNQIAKLLSVSRLDSWKWSFKQLESLTLDVVLGFIPGSPALIWGLPWAFWEQPMRAPWLSPGTPCARPESRRGSSGGFSALRFTHWPTELCTPVSSIFRPYLRQQGQKAPSCGAWRGGRERQLCSEQGGCTGAAGFHSGHQGLWARDAKFTNTCELHLFRV